MKNALGLMALLLLALSCQKPQPEMLELSCTPVLYTLEELRDTLSGRWLLDKVVINGEIQVPENREIWEFADTATYYGDSTYSAMLLEMKKITYINGAIDTISATFEATRHDDLIRFVFVAPTAQGFTLNLCEDEFVGQGTCDKPKYCKDLITGYHFQRIP
jgi:hypothetical protein